MQQAIRFASADTAVSIEKFVAAPIVYISEVQQRPLISDLEFLDK